MNLAVYVCVLVVLLVIVATEAIKLPPTTHTPIRGVPDIVRSDVCTFSIQFVVQYYGMDVSI